MNRLRYALSEIIASLGEMWEWLARKPVQPMGKTGSRPPMAFGRYEPLNDKERKV